LNPFIVSPSRDKKPQILTFGGLLYPASITDKGQIWLLEQTHGIRLHDKFRLDRFILSPSGGEKHQILLFGGVQHLVVSPSGGDLRQLNTGAQLRTFHYPMVSKSFLQSKAFMAKSGAQDTNSDVQKRDGQTSRQNLA